VLFTLRRTAWTVAWTNAPDSGRPGDHRSPSRKTPRAAGAPSRRALRTLSNRRPLSSITETAGRGGGDGVSPYASTLAPTAAPL